MMKETLQWVESEGMVTYMERGHDHVSIVTVIMFSILTLAFSSNMAVLKYSVTEHLA